MKKFILEAVILMMVMVSGASADIYNTQCMESQNKLYYNHNGLITHAWVFVNQEYKGEFWTVSSGSGSYSTPLNSGDHVIIYFYSDYEYGHDIAHCY